jgi:Predicted transcriptional regulators
MSDPTETAARGRVIVASGALQQLRERLGLTRTAMAELLHVSPVTYTRWEREPDVALWRTSAERIGRFYAQAELVLDQLEDDLTDLVPLYVAATYAALPPEILLRFYREGQIQAVDLGILGPWLHKEDLAKLALDQDFS